MASIAPVTVCADGGIIIPGGRGPGKGILIEEVGIKAWWLENLGEIVADLI